MPRWHTYYLTVCHGQRLGLHGKAGRSLLRQRPHEPNTILVSPGRVVNSFFFVDFVDPSFEQAECRRGNRERRSVVTGSGSIHDRYVLLIPTPQTADRRSPGEKTAAYLLQCLRTTVGFIELTATCNVGPRGGVPITRRSMTYPRPTRRGVRSI